MNIKRFTAPTSREALAKARMAFGDGTLILSNRQIAGGVEVMATAEDTLSSLESAAAEPAPVASRLQERAPAASRLQERAADMAANPAQSSRPLRAAQRAEAPRNPVAQDTEQLAMSTLSFQDYVRERMLRRRHEAMHGAAPAPAAAPQQLLQPERAPLSRPEAPRMAERAMAPASAPLPRHNPMHAIPLGLPPEQPVRERRVQAPVPSLAQEAGQQNLMSELQSMKDLIEDRFNTLAWLGQARQNPIQSNLMLKLIRAGYSPSLARAVLERLPEELGAGHAVRWLMEVLERNLKTDAHQRPLYEEGGVYAMVGATGVGKTTTTAKLAALCARIHGPASVGLITLDTYRVGAHEQLRSYGRMLGVVAHLAHDRAALQDLLGLLAGKKMVLIDTTGIAPRDPRKRDMLDVLDLPGVNRLLVLNAGCHGDTLDDVLTGFKTSGSQQAILSKVDEAVKLGPAVDALIRHQMVLRGVTNGQRVPEDWEAADAQKLIATSMRSPAKSAFDPKASDLNFFFSHSPELATERALVDA
ncbi:MULTISPECIES: flagellar biosynthesis protein FlhF [Paracidovorax]|uniref:flagellar biosynthesis protein FlhF n=1 Tax=Paracidovorax TaxID=3051137 RepID=UPI0003069962|nr:MULTISPECIES: flagellar biosynthesis protein FlhF [Paracidovorax]AVS81401.1 flagellar biosynthesis protein FlhF [Paracidovorax avenae]